MSDVPAAWDDMVLVGRIARTHGLRGHVVVNAETDFPETRFARGAACWTLLETGPVKLVMQTVRMQNGRPIVVFDGYEALDAVERLLGRELRIPEQALVPLPEGVYYHHQLVGCAVETVSGAPIGQVARVDQGAGGSLLVVEGESGEVLVPLVTNICAAIDMERRRIIIEPPEGLLDLNAPSEPRPRGRRRPEKEAHTAPAQPGAPAERS
jgi:16S rRNA processing protein RimM